MAEAILILRHQRIILQLWAAGSSRDKGISFLPYLTIPFRAFPKMALP
jgi:hypothetical protein